MYSVLHVFANLLKILTLVFVISSMCVILELVPYVVGVTERATMPTRVCQGWKLPPVVTEEIGSQVAERLGVGHDSSEPGFASEHVIERKLKHPHVNAVRLGRVQLNNLGHVWNFIHVANHHRRIVRNAVETQKNTIPLVLLAVPQADVANGRTRGTHDVSNLVCPWRKSILVLFVVQWFRVSSMGLCRLGEHKNVDILVEIFESHLQHVQLIKELKRVHNHFLVQK